MPRAALTQSPVRNCSQIALCWARWSALLCSAFASSWARDDQSVTSSAFFW
jgi:hypothetical protein